MQYISLSEQNTFEFAQKIASSLHEGDVVLLHGNLGAGKTAFTRGLAQGLGADSDLVCSPTFALMNHYQGKCDIFHFDLYRLSDSLEIYELGFDEYFFGNAGVCVVEWPSCVAPFFDDIKTKSVTLEGDDDTRTITLEGFDVLLNN